MIQFTCYSILGKANCIALNHNFKRWMLKHTSSWIGNKSLNHLRYLNRIKIFENYATRMDKILNLRKLKCMQKAQYKRQIKKAIQRLERSIIQQKQQGILKRRAIVNLKVWNDNMQAFQDQTMSVQMRQRKLDTNNQNQTNLYRRADDFFRQRKQVPNLQSCSFTLSNSARLNKFNESDIQEDVIQQGNHQGDESLSSLLESSGISNNESVDRSTGFYGKTDQSSQTKSFYLQSSREMRPSTTSCSSQISPRTQKFQPIKLQFDYIKNQRLTKDSDRFLFYTRYQKNPQIQQNHLFFNNQKININYISSPKRQVIQFGNKLLPNHSIALNQIQDKVIQYELHDMYRYPKEQFQRIANQEIEPQNIQKKVIQQEKFIIKSKQYQQAFVKVNKKKILEPGIQIKQSQIIFRKQFRESQNQDVQKINTLRVLIQEGNKKEEQSNQMTFKTKRLVIIKGQSNKLKSVKSQKEKEQES